jgi:long-chain acyl-CoA synthetase
VRGGNVTSGYYNNPEATAEAFADGWFHTGDIGELDSSGRLIIKGRKKEMIVLPDGRNVFPEDVESVLNAIRGVSESAVVGLRSEAGERVHAALVLSAGASAEDVIHQANAALEEHQKIRGYTLWTDPYLPRTEGTRKLKRAEIRRRLSGREAAPPPATAASGVGALLAKWSSGRAVDSSTTLDDLGLSSLDRVELLVALEQKLGVPLDENVFSQARTIADLQRLESAPPTSAGEDLEFPRWNRHWFLQWHRIFHLNLWILNLARLFAWVRVQGRENLKGLQGPVLFASNHQSYFDGPVLFIAMPWKWRHRLAPVMRKEFFEAHYHPERFPWYKRLTSNLNFYLSCHVFDAIPIPQRDAGARQSLRFLGEIVERGGCPLIFPEGKHSHDETIGRFQPGVAMIASRLDIPIVPVRIRGANRVLHPTWSFPIPGIVRVTIGKPIRLAGDDYLALAQQLENTVRGM